MLNWICCIVYLVIVVAAPFVPALQDNIEITMQALVAVCLLGWCIDLRKTGTGTGKKLLLYAFLGHSVWIALTDGRIRYTQAFARGEAITLAVLCGLLLLISKGVSWKKSA